MPNNNSDMASQGTYIWLMLQNRIWTAACLQLRGWPNEYICQLCIRNLETTQHLFRECHVTRNVSEEVAKWIQAAFFMSANWNHTTNMGEWFIDLVVAATTSIRPGLQSMVMLTIC